MMMVYCILLQSQNPSPFGWKMPLTRDLIPFQREKRKDPSVGIQFKSQRMYNSMNILWFVAVLVYYCPICKADENKILLEHIGLSIENFITIRPYNTERIDLRISWKFLIPAVSQAIRHDCGKQLFNEFLDGEIGFKSVNCSLEQFYGDITFFLNNKDSTLNENIKLDLLEVSPFKENEDEECMLHLKGIEKFEKIFIAYLEKDKTIIQAPNMFQDLIGLQEEFVIFDPDMGKGGSFQSAKECIRELFRNWQDLEEIDERCHFECWDNVDDNDAKLDKQNKIEL